MARDELPLAYLDINLDFYPVADPGSTSKPLPSGEAVDYSQPCPGASPCRPAVSRRQAVRRRGIRHHLRRNVLGGATRLSCQPPRSTTRGFSDCGPSRPELTHMHACIAPASLTHTYEGWRSPSRPCILSLKRCRAVSAVSAAESSPIAQSQASVISVRQCRRRPRRPSWAWQMLPPAMRALQRSKQRLSACQIGLAIPPFFCKDAPSKQAHFRPRCRSHFICHALSTPPQDGAKKSKNSVAAEQGFSNPGLPTTTSPQTPQGEKLKRQTHFPTWARVGPVGASERALRPESSRTLKNQSVRTVCKDMSSPAPSSACGYTSPAEMPCCNRPGRQPHPSTHRFPALTGAS